MSNAEVPHLEAFIMTSKALVKKVYIIGGIIFAVAVAAWIWGELNWDEYTHVVENVLTGEVSTVGPASIAVSWGAVFAIAIPVVYGLMWFTIDTKNPSLGANNRGLFLNREGFRMTFIRWTDFSHIEKRIDGEYRLYMKDPQQVIDRQPAATRAFLRKTYVTDKSPIVIGGNDKQEENRIADLIGKYGMSRP
jgi:hypothetical protein